MKTKVRNFRIALLLILAVFGIYISLMTYRNSVLRETEQATLTTLGEITDQYKHNFNAKFTSEKQSLAALADVIVSMNVKDTEKLSFLMNAAIPNSTFERFSIVGVDGVGIGDDGNPVDIGKQEYFLRALENNPILSDPTVSKSDPHKKSLSLAQPIAVNGKVVAVLVGEYDADALNKVFYGSSFDGAGYACIVLQNGEMIAEMKHSTGQNSTTNLFSTLSNSTFYQYDNFSDITRKMVVGENGYARYNYNGEKLLVRYEPLGINDWYIFSTVPDEIISGQAEKVMARTNLLIVAVIVMALLVSLYIFLAQRKHIKEISFIAYVDRLTGAANKNQFYLSAAELLQRNSHKYALAILDIDRFKLLNTSLGYQTGDQLLKLVAGVLTEHIGAAETFARLDSDEFYLLLLDEGTQDLKSRLDSILNRVTSLFKSEINSNYKLVANVGVYEITDDSLDVSQMTDLARLAHKTVKGGEHNRVAFYNKDISERLLHEKEIENRMQSALINAEFKLYLQPKFSLKNERIAGAESLVRWEPDNQKMIYPDSFIPLFERNGFIIKLDFFIFEKTCAGLRGLIDKNIVPVVTSVNFSRRHLDDSSFVEKLCVLADQYQIPHGLLEIELTESGVLENETEIIVFLQKLHMEGFAVSIDDFGSGYSSLGLLKDLHVDTLKLDKGFFMDTQNEERAAAIVRSVIAMAKELHIHTVAEGIEIASQVQLLKSIGCDMVQGYYYARPMPEGEYYKQLEDNTQEGLL